MARRTYTTRFIKEIADYIEETHCTLDDASTKFEVPKSSIHNKMQRLEGDQGERVRKILRENSIIGGMKGGCTTAKLIKEGKFQRIDDSKIKELVKEQKSNAEIAKETGYSVYSVSKYAVKHRNNKREITKSELSDLELEGLKRRYYSVTQTLITGQSVKIVNSKENIMREGKVIQKNKNMFTLQCKGFKESFNFADLYCGSMKAVVI